MGIFIGIDPGVRGAIAFLDEESGRLISVFDMPVVEDGPNGRKRVNPAILTAIVGSGGSTVRRAFLEKVGARPKEGAVGAFSFGRSVGVVEGVLAALLVPVESLTPQRWKGRLHFPAGADKEFSRGRALEIWPAHAEAFKLKKDDGRAEAALIAFAGSMGGF